MRRPDPLEQSAAEVVNLEEIEVKDNWQPGDDPEAHPRFLEEVEWEHWANKEGAQQARKRNNEAKDKGHYDRTDGARRALLALVPKMADGIRQWLRHVSNEIRKGANHQAVRRTSNGTLVPLEYYKIKQMDPDECAYLTLRILCNVSALAVSDKQPGLLTVLKSVGRDIEHQLHMQELEANCPALFRDVEKELRKEHATSIYREKRFRYLLRDMAKKGATERDLWPENTVIAVGKRLVEIALFHTGAFELDNAMTFGANGRPSTQKVLKYTEDTRKKITDATYQSEINTPLSLPTLIPPRRWTRMRRGGYVTPWVNQRTMIRFAQDSYDRRANILAEFDAVAMDQVYAALNAMQETPWSLNKRVYEVAKFAYEHDWSGIESLKMPRREAIPLPERPSGIPEKAKLEKLNAYDQKRMKLWRRACHKVHKLNKKAPAYNTIVGSILNISSWLAEKEEFYFPHSLDFRGRTYPIPAFLHPQGIDLARGLLKYGPGAAKPLGEEGAYWLAIELANRCGLDKKTMQERLDYVRKNKKLWLAIAADPIHDRRWTDFDEPWQALAAIFEWVGYLTFGPSYPCALVVRVDGTCNGIQHLAALARDPDAGRAVNLIPGEGPQDIYAEVAYSLFEKLCRIEAGGGDEGSKASFWLEKAANKKAQTFPRSLTKRQVMIMPYGGKLQAYFKYAREWVDENKLDDALDALKEIDEKLPGRTLHTLCKTMWDAVTHRLPGPIAVMEWLQGIEKVMSARGLPIYWQLPSGFLVRQFYGAPVKKRLERKIGGESIRMWTSKRSLKLSTKEQHQGIAPNFVHSLDACVLHLAICIAIARGVTNITAIHDAYGTVPADMAIMQSAIREAFVMLHEQDPLTMFYTSCRNSLMVHIAATEGRSLEDDYEEIAEEAERLLGASFPRGTLDIREVLNSEYFFS